MLYNVKHMVIVITGVAGFVGSNLAKSLLQKGNTIIGIDSFSSDAPLEPKQYRLNELSEYRNFHFHKLDVLNDGILSGILGSSCDYFVHLASKDIYYSADVVHKSFFEFFEVNTLGTVKMYELAHNMSAKKFITASTFSVYGNTRKKVFTEKKLLPDPVSPHGASKVAMESSLKYLNHHYKLPCIIPRIFSVYGPNMPTHTAVYHMIASALTGKKLKLHGDFFTQTRDYIYIDDVINYIESMFNKRLNFQIVNIATGKTTSLKEMVEIVNEYTKVGIENYEHAGRIDLTKIVLESVQADTSKAEKIFKYKAQIDVKTGIKKTLEWYKNHPEFLAHTYY